MHITDQRSTKIIDTHLQKIAYVYLRQSSMGQVRNHRESTERQYALQDLARNFGWPVADSPPYVLPWNDPSSATIECRPSPWRSRDHFRTSLIAAFRSSSDPVGRPTTA